MPPAQARNARAPHIRSGIDQDDEGAESGPFAVDVRGQAFSTQMASWVSNRSCVPGNERSAFNAESKAPKFHARSCIGMGLLPTRGERNVQGCERCTSVRPDRPSRLFGHAAPSTSTLRVFDPARKLCLPS
jgi:hypothetical protein